jgi:hypothetical protein
VWGDGVQQGISAPDVDFRCFFLHGPRMKMYRRVDRRCEEMVRRVMPWAPAGSRSTLAAC